MKLRRFLRCPSPASCGSLRGLRILSAARPGSPAQLDVADGTVATENVRRLRVPGRTVIDGTRVEPGVVCCCPWAACEEERDVETLGPLRRIWARPVALVHGNTTALADAAVQLARAWFHTARGNARVVADAAWEPRPGEHAVLLGGPAANRATAENPFFAALLGPGGAVGPCAVGSSGLVALGPGRAGPLELVVAGENFAAARRAFESRLFDVNSWQHRGPEYLLLGGDRLPQLRAAGYWGPRWEFVPEAAYTSC